MTPEPELNWRERRILEDFHQCLPLILDGKDPAFKYLIGWVDDETKRQPPYGRRK